MSTAAAKRTCKVCWDVHLFGASKIELWEMRGHRWNCLQSTESALFFLKWYSTVVDFSFSCALSLIWQWEVIWSLLPCIILLTTQWKLQTGQIKCSKRQQTTQQNKQNEVTFLLEHIQGYTFQKLQKYESCHMRFLAIWTFERALKWLLCALPHTWLSCFVS